MTNTREIQFLRDNYDKEKLKRLNWFYKNIDAIQKSATVPLDPLDRTPELIGRFKEEYNKGNREPVIENKTCVGEINIKNKQPEAISPVDGRERQTCKSAPQKIYKYPVCTNMTYGWHLGEGTEDVINYNKQYNRRKPVVYERTAISPDPRHYKVSTPKESDE